MDNTLVFKGSKLIFFLLSEKIICHQVRCHAVNNVQIAALWEEIRVKMIKIVLFLF